MGVENQLKMQKKKKIYVPKLRINYVTQSKDVYFLFHNWTWRLARSIYL